MDEIETRLREATRCLLAVRGARGPLLSPMAVWYDGAGLWTTTSAAAVKASVLRRAPACALYVPPADGHPGLVVDGSARVFGLHDPLGTALHAATISAAMTALAARNAGTILGYAQDAARVPTRWAPRNRVVLRIRIDDARVVAEPDLAPGMAPTLPTVIPPDVRRAVGGSRRVVLAVDGGDGLTVLPAGWGAGFALVLPAGVEVPPGARVQAVVDHDPQGQPTKVVGLAVHGAVDARGALVPDRYTWWHGFDLATVDAPPPSASGFQLPD
jgi:hypothetical protein